jgi:hypothetical protein
MVALRTLPRSFPIRVVYFHKSAKPACSLGTVAKGSLCAREMAKAMAPAKTPTDAIREMLAEELSRLILALPKDLQESVPAELMEETGLKEEDETDKT